MTDKQTDTQTGAQTGASQAAGHLVGPDKRERSAITHELLPPHGSSYEQARERLRHQHQWQQREALPLVPQGTKRPTHRTWVLNFGVKDADTLMSIRPLIGCFGDNIAGSFTSRSGTGKMPPKSVVDAAQDCVQRVARRIKTKKTGTDLVLTRHPDIAVWTLMYLAPIQEIELPRGAEAQLRGALQESEGLLDNQPPGSWRVHCVDFYLDALDTEQVD